MTHKTDPMRDGPGLFEVARENGDSAVTNVRRLAGSRSAPGRGLINTAAILLILLDAGLFAVSLAAQYQYIFHAKHQSWPAVIEAVALDAGMVIFSLLALGLARGRQAAPVERTLIVVCAFGSAAMNYGAADVSSARSVAAYVMPPVFLAIVTDRVIATVRRHMLGMEAERSAWAIIGRAVLAVLAAAGTAVLYMLRLVLAPRSTLSGARSLVLLATPLPGAHALAQERAQVDAARAALGTVRAAIDGDLRDLRDSHAAAAANLDDKLRAAQEASRAEIQAVREAVRAETDTAFRAALGTVRISLGQDLRELQERHEQTAGGLADGLRATRNEFRAEIGSVLDGVRAEVQAVREAARKEAAGALPVMNGTLPSPPGVTAIGPEVSDPASDVTATGPGVPGPASDVPGPAAPWSGAPIVAAVPVAASAPALSFIPALHSPAAELFEKAEIQFADLVADRKVPSLRQIKAELHVGPARAREVSNHLAALAANGFQQPGTMPPLIPQAAATLANHAEHALGGDASPRAAAGPETDGAPSGRQPLTGKSLS
jgi:hypothetical protein